jgi:NAD(P)-dependent dehydrogenase (short-subunit alcohol dehydrogenase family)
MDGQVRRVVRTPEAGSGGRPKALSDAPVAVVTAAGGLMGAAITRALAASGHQLVINDRRDCLDERLADLELFGVKVVSVVGDVAHPAGAAATIGAAVEQLGRVDVLVNVAGGIKGPIENPLWEITPEQWSRTLAVNLDSAFFCMQHAARAMMTRHSGNIVNIASTSWAGSPLHAHYAAAKAGLVSLTRSAAQQLGSYGINVNVIAPGGTVTRAADLPGFPTAQDWLARNPLGRPNDAEDIAGAVAFLSSAAARNISGQVLTVAGGLNPSL